MDDVEFDQIIARAGNPNLIPGIYNYCDRRCERCPFTERCFQYLETQRERAQVREGAGAETEEESVGRAVARSLERSVDMLRIIGRRLGIDLTAETESPESGADIDADIDIDIDIDVDANQRPALSQIIQQQDVQAEDDPLVRLAREYANIAWPILRALGPVLRIRGEAALLDALETLELYSASISAKVFRAVMADTGPDFDRADLQNDANGSVKVARLMIQDSRRAWRTLMEPGQATEDGVPARLVRLLDDLDNRLGARFPRAMDFRRPGFDTDFPGTGLGVCSPGCRAATPSSIGEKPAALLVRSSS